LSREIEIRLPRCRLVLYEKELLALLKEHPGIWAAGLKRGKGLIRARQANNRREKNYNETGA
jgi:hypothetical protein